MGAVSLAEESYRRRNKPAGAIPEAQSSQDRHDHDVIFMVTEEILRDYADVVYAVSTGAKAPGDLERLVSWIVTEKGYLLRGGKEETIKTVCDNILRYGILQDLIDDPAVTDIFVNGPQNVYKRVNNEDIFCPEVRFRESRHLEQYIRTILAKAGRRITRAECLVDTRDVPNHLRINAGIGPAAKIPYLCIRKHTVADFTEDDFYRTSTFTPEISGFIRQAVKARLNILIAGPAGSGKTTLMRFIASNFIPDDERIVVLEHSCNT